MSSRPHTHDSRDNDAEHDRHEEAWLVVLAAGALLTVVVSGLLFVRYELEQGTAYASMHQVIAVVAMAMVAVGCSAVLGFLLIRHRHAVVVLRHELGSERERRAAAGRLAAVMRQANDIILVMDEKGRILEANDYALAAYGYTIEELRGLPPGGLGPPRSAERSQESELSRAEGGGVFETEHRRKNGSLFPVEVSGRSFEIDGIRYRLAIFRDISDRKAQEQQIERLNRMYSALSQINHAIVHSPGETQLFASVCRALVESGSFVMVWVGTFDAGTDAIVPAAHFGDRNGYLENFRIPDVSNTETSGPIRTAFRSGHTYVCHDLTADPSAGPWRDVALRHGYAAMVALPVRIHDSVAGVLAGYAERRNCFTTPEVSLLEEAAEDISFALGNMAREARRLSAEAALRESEQRYRSLFDHMHTGFAYCRMIFQNERPVDFIYLAVNEAFARLTGLSNVVGRKVSEVIPGIAESDAPLLEHYGRVARTGEPERFEFHVSALKMWFDISAYCPEPGCFVAVFDVITERKQAAEALRYAHERVTRIIDANIVGIAVTDTVGRVLEANDYYLRLVGTGRAEFKAGSIELPAITPPEWLSADERASRELRERGKCAPFEKEYLRRNGRRVRVFLAKALLPGPEQHVVNFALDLTQRDEAENRVFEALQFNETLIAHLPVGVIVWDESGKGVAANEAAARIVGCTRGELLAQNFRLLESWKRSGMLKAAEAALSADTEQELEAHVVSSFGKWLWLSTRFVPFSHSGHRHLLVISNDVTARRQAEERIREQAELIDKANEAIVVTDLDARITFWNHGAERLFGRSSFEMVGKMATEMPTDIGGGAEPDVRTALTEFDDWRGEIRALNSEGEKLALEMSITMLRDDAGKPKGRLSISTNITEKKRLAEQFLRAQRLESIGMLASGIAHDLNNVLAPVRMAAPMLRVNATAPSDVRLLDTLEKCAERGAALVRQILGFAHGLGGEPSVIQAKHILRDIAHMIVETFPKSIVLEERIEADLWPVLANPTQIHQVLLNLAVNARDAMPQGGTLCLKAYNRVLDAESAQKTTDAMAGDWVVLEVADSGTGIASDVLPRIWEPFFTTKSADRGTGLGLSTVRGIVEAHHGFTVVETAPGRGTTFQVFLPAAAEAKESRSPFFTPAAEPGHGERVLLVDDEEPILMAASAILTRAGYAVSTARDGADALTQFTRDPGGYALVITDRDMPALGGAALAQNLRLQNPNIKIVMMSGLSREAGSQDLGPSPAADAFLSKPFAADKLLRVVSELLGSTS